MVELLLSSIQNGLCITSIQPIQSGSEGHWWASEILQQVQQGWWLWGGVRSAASGSQREPRLCLPPNPCQNLQQQALPCRMALVYHTHSLIPSGPVYFQL